jgi:hypothetical protein
MDATDLEQRRARLRDPLTYTTVGEWYDDYHGFVPIQMAQALSRVIAERGISFPEAYRLLRDAGAIIEIEPEGD